MSVTSAVAEFRAFCSRRRRRLRRAHVSLFPFRVRLPHTQPLTGYVWVLGGGLVRGLYYENHVLNIWLSFGSGRGECDPHICDNNLLLLYYVFS